MGLTVPVLINAFRHADELSLAMDARGFGSEPERTLHHALPVTPRDVITVLTVWVSTILLALAVSWYSEGSRPCAPDERMRMVFIGPGLSSRPRMVAMCAGRLFTPALRCVEPARGEAPSPGTPKARDPEEGGGPSRDDGPGRLRERRPASRWPTCGWQPGSRG